jgi:hypothetical protein
MMNEVEGRKKGFINMKSWKYSQRRKQIFPQNKGKSGCSRVNSEYGMPGVAHWRLFDF